MYQWFFTRECEHFVLNVRSNLLVLVLVLHVFTEALVTLLSCLRISDVLVRRHVFCRLLIRTCFCRRWGEWHLRHDRRRGWPCEGQFLQRLFIRPTLRCTSQQRQLSSAPGMSTFFRTFHFYSALLFARLNSSCNVLIVTGLSSEWKRNRELTCRRGCWFVGSWSWEVCISLTSTCAAPSSLQWKK